MVNDAILWLEERYPRLAEWLGERADLQLPAWGVSLITHLVLLSWDSEFDDYTRTGTGKSAVTFRDQLQLATLPLWLRPLAYPLPAIAGFEGRSVTVFEVVDEQELHGGAGFVHGTALVAIKTSSASSGRVAMICGLAWEIAALGISRASAVSGA